MTRKTAREIAVQLGFAAANSYVGIETLIEQFFDEEHYSTLGAEDSLFEEYPDEGSMEYIKRLLTLLDANKAEIDGLIERFSKGWKVERISKTALAILRCAVCEILYMDDIPNAAAINEAVELDKGYDEAETVSFVNGVLGGIVRRELSADELNTDTAEEIAGAEAETASENSADEASELAGDAPEFADDQSGGEG